MMMARGLLVSVSWVFMRIWPPSERLKMEVMKVKGGVESMRKPVRKPTSQVWRWPDLMVREGR